MCSYVCACVCGAVCRVCVYVVSSYILHSSHPPRLEHDGVQHEAQALNYVHSHKVRHLSIQVLLGLNLVFTAHNHKHTHTLNYTQTHTVAHTTRLHTSNMAYTHMHTHKANATCNIA